MFCCWWWWAAVSLDCWSFDISISICVSLKIRSRPWKLLVGVCFGVMIRGIIRKKKPNPCWHSDSNGGRLRVVVAVVVVVAAAVAAAAAVAVAVAEVVAAVVVAVVVAAAVAVAVVAVAVVAVAVAVGIMVVVVVVVVVVVSSSHRRGSVRWHFTGGMTRTLHRKYHSRYDSRLASGYDSWRSHFHPLQIVYTVK